MNVIGNGVVVHVPGLFEEIAEMQEKGVKVRGCYNNVTFLLLMLLVVACGGACFGAVFEKVA
jgi:hypothetical protein